MCRQFKRRYGVRNKREIMLPVRISSHVFRKSRCAKKSLKKICIANFLHCLVNVVRWCEIRYDYIRHG